MMFNKKKINPPILPGMDTNKQEEMLPKETFELRLFQAEEADLAIDEQRLIIFEKEHYKSNSTGRGNNYFN